MNRKDLKQAHLDVLIDVYNGHQIGDEPELLDLESWGYISLDTGSNGVESYWCTGLGYDYLDLNDKHSTTIEDNNHAN